MDKLTVEELSHRESFADFAKEIEIINILKPIVVVDHGDIIGVDDVFDLGFDTGLVVFDFIERFEIAFAVLLGVADLTSGATN